MGKSGSGDTAARVFTDAKAFRRTLPERGSLLALDASRRRIGIAGTDPRRRLVTPLSTLIRRGEAADFEVLSRLAAEREAAGLVLGWPLNMDGSEGAMAREARRLAQQLAHRLALPVLLQDERLTSFAVEEALREGRLPRRRARDAHLDHFAAAVILEDALREIRADSEEPSRRGSVPFE